KIADHVEQFMACWLVLIAQLDVVQNSFLRHVDIITVKKLGQIPKFIFADFFVYHDDSIVQVATFYEVVLKQHFQFMEEAEGPGRDRKSTRLNSSHVK